MAGDVTGPRRRRRSDSPGGGRGDAPDAGRNGTPGRDAGESGHDASEAQARAARLLRVTFAPGSARDATDPPADAPAVFQVDGPGSSVVDPTGRRASLEAVEPPRARLTTYGNGQAGQAPTQVGTEAGTHAGTHAVLLTPLPDVRRAAAGVQRVEVVVGGWRFEVDVESEARARLRERATSARASTGKGGPSELRAIIPGRVVSVDVAEGDLVDAGGRLLVLEAMKMQNEVRAPRAGTVARLAVGAGQTVELGDVLLVIE